MDVKTYKFYANLFGNVTRVNNMKPEAKICYSFARELRSLTRADLFDCVWFSVPNEYAGRKLNIFGAMLRSLGKFNGVSDYIFLWETGCCCIEFKTPVGKLSDDQLKYKEWCRLKKVPYYVARSKEDGLNILKNYGLIK